MLPYLCIADFSDAVVKDSIELLGSQSAVAARKAVLKRLESPFERFARLKTELMNFQEDLDRLAKEVSRIHTRLNMLHTSSQAAFTVTQSNTNSGVNTYGHGTLMCKSTQRMRLSIPSIYSTEHNETCLKYAGRRI